MKSDIEQKNSMVAEFGRDPAIHGTGIDVEVNQNVMALYGQVENLLEEFVGQQTAGRVAGIRGVSNQIQLRPDTSRDGLRSRIEPAVQDAAHRYATVDRLTTVN